MGIESEFGKAAENVFSTPLLSQIIRELDVADIINSGTSLPEEDVKKLIVAMSQRTETVEDIIRTGGSNWEARQLISKGVLPIVTEAGGRAMSMIAESIANTAGYEGELHRDILEPSNAFYTMMTVNPMTRSMEVTLFSPLRGAGVLGKKGERWQAAAFRGLGEEGVFGVALLRTEPASTK